MDRRDFIKRSIGVASGLAIAPSVALPKEKSSKKLNLGPGDVTSVKDSINRPIIPEQSEYFIPTKTNIEKLKQAIGWAESKNFKINRILCTPKFLDKLNIEMDSISNVYWGFCISGGPTNLEGLYLRKLMDNRQRLIYGCKVESQEDLLGHFALSCDEVFAIFRE